MEKQLKKNTIVLLGAGHTNAHILRMWKMKPIENAQLICVSNHPVATYSGMMPGVLAGQYNVSAMEIDLVRFCSAAGIRLIIGQVKSVDRQERELRFSNRPPLGYDFLSIGVGSRPSFDGVDVHDDSHLLPIKPMQTFLQRLSTRLASVANTNRTLRIGVVGGGIGSIEVAFCLDRRLQENPTELGTSPGQPFQVSLITGSERTGAGLIDSTIHKIEKQLHRHGIENLTSARVTAIDGCRLDFKNVKSQDFDVIIWATNAVGPAILQQLNLDTDCRGFLKTRSTLQTVSDDRIFAVGDTATLVDYDLPKAGVYAVRQGPFLWENLQRSIQERKLSVYRPQQKFLKLVNTADGQSIAEYGQRSFSGRWCWYLKDRIDRKFMNMYQDYQPMPMIPDPPAPSDEPMRCLGCGGKIGSQMLSSILAELDVPTHPDVMIGLEAPDDAAILRTEDNQVTVTTDFFASPLDDPYLTGRISVLNSISDCFVMGAQPTGALAMVQLPLGHPRSQRQVMRELMAGAVEELNRAQAAIVGGHSIEGPRLIAGFTVLGKQLTDPKTKGRLETGDQIVLTKPIGSGILLAGLMQGRLPASDYQLMIENMLKSNQIALTLMQKFGINAMTDVTGFGLAGHLAEMLKASQVSARLAMNAIPVLAGVDALLGQGIQSTLAPDNRLAAEKVKLEINQIEPIASASLFDPQTCGGLLFGVSQSKVNSVLGFLSDHGFNHAAVIGEVIAAHPSATLRVSPT